jgi:hypothetical protein
MCSFDGLPAELENFVDHLDGNRQNARLTNLEYVTRKENNTRARRSSHVGKCAAPVEVMSVSTMKWHSYESLNDAARRLGLNVGSVHACLSGRIVTSGGYKFRRVTSPNIDGEEWKLVPGMCKEVHVSNFGRFRDSRGVTKTVKPRADGYCNVKIGNSSYQLHRLIATAFSLARTTEQDVVDHINGNKSDNRLVNLRWVTVAQNNAFAARNSNPESLQWPVLGRRVSEDTWVEYKSANEAARICNLHNSSVSQCATNSGHTHGYEFVWLPQSPDLPGEAWTDLLIPLKPFDPSRVRVYNP